jgi:predicted HNH restriction endonuclease
MSNVWKFTGNPENWITAIGIEKWALNTEPRNISLWESKIKEGDTIIFHSTANTDFSTKAKSSIIGFGYVGSPKTKKDDLWWFQETRDHKNYWPFVIPIKEIYLFSDTSKVDLDTPIQGKNDKQIEEEIQLLLKNSITVSDLNTRAKEINPEVSNFSVLGSASRVNPIYEQLILEQDKDLFLRSKTQQTKLLEEKLSETLDDKISLLSEEEVLSQAKIFDNSQEVSHNVKFGEKKIRKENQAQKRRVAKIENHTCQVCGFKSEYTRANGKKGWIIHVDHIIEKSDGGNENLNNLWVLCPNCHSKKTYGVITIDTEKKKVYENGVEVQIKDKHLF